MKEKKFIYIFEDGSIVTGPEPGEDDFEAVEDGDLQIIDPISLTEYDRDGGGWIKIEKGEDF